VAPFVPFLYGCQVEIVHQLDTQILSNRLWFQFDTGPFTLAELQGCADGVALWWTDLILPFLSQDLITANVSAKDWTADPPPEIATTVINVAGGEPSESSSANVALIVPFRWPLTIRLKKNKHYLPGIPESAIELNRATDGFCHNIFEGYSALIDRARLFSPVLHWRWMGASSWSAGVLRDQLEVWEIQGTTQSERFVLGQRRKRLPPSSAP